jgi:predicted nucleotidyltransferase
MSSSALHLAAAITEREHVLLSGRSDYAASMPVLPDKLGALRAVLKVLADVQVPHALIGGLAVGIRSGIPRATLDVDIAIPTGADRARIAEQLLQVGFTLVGEFAHSINFKHDSGEPVQLAYDPGFDPMIERAELIDVGDLRIPVVTKDDLIEMKRRAAADPMRRRSKALRDQADIALLEGDVPDPDEGW